MIRPVGRRGAGPSALFTLFVALFAASHAVADAGWFESGDAQLRMDLQLLNDAEVIRLPVNTWPMPRAAVEYAMERAKSQSVVNQAVSLALERVKARVAPRAKTRLGAWAAAGEPGLLRDFDSFARERGELGAHADFDAGRFSASLKVGGVVDPADDQSLRADGSHATLLLGNWLVSAHTLERFWGPSHESSLILSNNARPMPTVMLERAEARAFETPLLSWLGPWRMSFGISRMESDREDIDAPLFMAWRVVVMPFKKFEIGLSRTAQFCGKQLECNLHVFGNLLVGRDNVGINTTAQEEPGNQMAGFDMRWNSPLGNLPYALYSQYIGEDQSSGIPAKYLAQLGIEGWKPHGDGGLIQMFAEYSSTTCSANTNRGPYYNCAYNQGRFKVEGYRYEGRVIGYTADADAETYSVGAIYLSPAGATWSITARNAVLNRDNVDTRDLVSPVRSAYNALELGWRGKFHGETLSVDLGVESREPVDAKRDVGAYGFMRWSHEFDR